MGAITLTTVLTLASILNGLGGAGVSFARLVDWLKDEHSEHPDEPLPAAHAAKVQQALIAWTPPAYDSQIKAAQALMRSGAGSLRMYADQLDERANSLQAEISG